MVGSLLSGGLDISSITSLASKKLLEQGKANIDSFSVDIADHGAEFVSNGFRDTPDFPYVIDLFNNSTPSTTTSC